jgi:predicted secreted hydrolase
VDKSGRTTEIKRQDFLLEVTNTWRSPHSQADYPSGWKISIPKMDIQLSIIPVLEDQELNLAVVYWEGAVNVSGEIQGNTVRGRGYVELTGYAQNMQGQF